MVPEQITVRARTVVTEIAAAGALIGSYPLDWLVRRGESYFCAPSSEPVILIHGFGGNRSNLLALAAYPLVIEPHMTLAMQRDWWMVGFCVFGGLCGWLGVKAKGHAAEVLARLGAAA